VAADRLTPRAVECIVWLRSVINRTMPSPWDRRESLGELAKLVRRHLPAGQSYLTKKLVGEVRALSVSLGAMTDGDVVAPPKLRLVEP